jgi:phage-related protein
MKDVVFHPKARDTLRSFPDSIKDQFGQALYMLQQGHRLRMPLSRPMPTIAKGVEELRIKGRDGAYRALYFNRRNEEVLVFHVFVKKTEKTNSLDIELGRKRLKEVLHG